jgi:hypothetical protein
VKGGSYLAIPDRAITKVTFVARQGKPRAVHHRARRDRSLTTAAIAFEGVSPAFQRGRAAAAAGRTNRAYPVNAHTHYM